MDDRHRLCDSEDRVNRVHLEEYTFKLAPTASSPDAPNMFIVELDGAGAAGATAHSGMLTLFPHTYKGHEHGMRIDLEEAMAATVPNLWRFPGGNSLEVRNAGYRGVRSRS